MSVDTHDSDDSDSDDVLLDFHSAPTLGSCYDASCSQSTGAGSRGGWTGLEEEAGRLPVVLDCTNELCAVDEGVTGGERKNGQARKGLVRAANVIVDAMGETNGVCGEEVKGDAKISNCPVVSELMESSMVVDMDTGVIGLFFLSFLYTLFIPVRIAMFLNANIHIC